MKNTTVRELIDILTKMNQDAVLCYLEIDGNKECFSTFEICREFKNVTYINDDGDDINGDVVAIY